MDWTNLLTTPGNLVGLMGLLGVVYTAWKSGNTSLPEHQDRELKRMSSEGNTLRRRLDHIESWNVALSDHVDTLESHIWRQLPPPPPPRPKYHPFTEETS